MVGRVHDGSDCVKGGVVGSSNNGPGDRTAGYGASKYLPAGHITRSCSRIDAGRRAIGMNFFLSDPLRPAGDVWGVDGVDAAQPSVLYASTGP